MDRFAKIRDDNLKEQSSRFNKVVSEYRDIALLMEEKSRLIKTFDSAILTEDGFKEYTRNIRDINAKISQGLKSHGFPEDYLAPIYTCVRCQDKGFVYEDGVTPKRCPACNRELHSPAVSFDDFNLQLFSKEKKEGFKLSPYEAMLRNFQTAREYCDAFPHNQKRNLLFYGASGLGKSFLASCICTAINAKGYEAIKVNAFDLIEDFKNKHVSSQPYPRDYFGCDFLAIDDIGTEPIYNNITQEYLFALVNERIEKGKATLYITNQSYDNCVSRYDERLASRIFDGINTVRMTFIGDNVRMSR